jgi:hypothetical protein
MMNKWRGLYAKLPGNVRARLEVQALTEPPSEGIRSDHEYRVAQQWAARFRVSIAAAEQAGAPPGVRLRRHTASIAAMRAQLEELERELRRYENAAVPDQRGGGDAG